jgi:hypothetical protein
MGAIGGRLPHKRVVLALRVSALRYCAIVARTLLAALHDAG